MIKKAIRKPVEVEYVVYNGINHQEVIDFTEGKAVYKSAVGGDERGNGHPQSYEELSIETIVGKTIIRQWDYVVKNPQLNSPVPYYSFSEYKFLAHYDIVK